MEMMGYRYMVKKSKNERKMMMNNTKLKNDLNGLGIGSNSGPLLVLHLPDLRILSVMSRSLFVVLFLFALPLISSKMSSSSQINFKSNLGYLVEEGILKKGHQGLFVVNSSIDEGNLLVKDFDLLNLNQIDLTFSVESNVNIPNDGFDFVFVQNLKNIEAIDRVIKLGGVLISKLENNKRYQVLPSENYAVVFARSLENSMAVLRKIRHPSSMKKMPGKQSLCGITPQANKSALLCLEEAMLEPPSKEMAKKSKLSRKMKFLPDLLEDSLQNYPRRIFLSDGDKGVTDWFKKNYPTRGQEFEFFDMEVVANKTLSGVGLLLSDWLRNHVKEEDYVVMKAEATLVEEMIKENTACLVDELFLECKIQWGDEEYDEEEVAGKRPYWQCLTLYGKLLDEGVAVHQWWS